MKRGITTLLLASALLPLNALAQILSVTPAFPSQNDTVTIIYDATEGNGALTGVVPVYAHAGLITNQSTSPTDWKHVQGNWGTTDASVLMTNLGNNLHKIEYHMPTFYGFGSSVIVQKMAFVFRNGNGTIVGRDPNGNDIYYDVYPANAGLIAQFLAPETTQLISSGDSLEFVIAATQKSDFKIYDNGTLVYQDSTKQDNFYLGSTLGGIHTVVLQADHDTSTVYDTAYYAVQGPLNVGVMPSGREQGINELNDTTVFFKLYAPFKNRVYCLTSLNDFLPDTLNAMTRTPGGSWWFLEMTVPAGQPFTYQYMIDGDLRVADPYSEQVLDPWNDGYISSATYPNLPDYPTGKTTGIVSLYETAKPVYQWKNSTFNAPDKEELLIYELLIRDFVSTRNYQSLIDTLDYIERLGVNAIELMPNSEFEGNSSWGYNPSFHMALDKYYGTPDKFREFVDSCHSRGIAVIMDQVFNHAFGQNPIAQMWWDSGNNRPAANNPYMNQNCPHPPNCWGNDFDHYVQPTRDYMDRINTYWIENFNIDGIRFDFTKGFTNSSNADSYQSTRIAALKRMADECWNVDQDFYVILEHWGPNQEEKELSDYGMLLWGNAAHQYYEAAMGYTPDSDFKWGIYKERGWNDKHLISYMESHDEERASYKIKTYGNSSGGYDTKTLATRADRIIQASAFFYTIPGPKMIYMFEELGYDISIDNPCRVCEKPILWNYYNDQHRQKIYFYMASMMDMRKKYDVFNTSNFTYALNGASKRINLNSSSMNATVVGNFDVVQKDVYPNFQQTGIWYDYFSGDSITVTNASAPISFAPGEWHIYTDVKLTDAAFMDITEAGLTNLKPFMVYPNPSAGVVDILLDFPQGTAVAWSLRDVRGKVAAQGSLVTDGPQITGLDFAALPKGAYILQLQTPAEVYAERLLLN
ncbi:alpha-amylase family glycosyl hydrolase [Schleiferiaceae bacterium]|nr:alpha-amylase family glycosyl hydrolase [Schleiferiaceae bacterium]MDC1225374.1 alpha-amylase family glycosyl hydrolase [Schleiferiaceae bacterium]MDC1493839.1 alpha-amylase family glycosyl hydrolase [Schleiferiaceae bacterium]